MSNTIQYSVLRYSPSIISGESINLGILFVAKEFRDFRYTKNFTRIREFDDTLDIDTLKVLLSSITDEVKLDIISFNKEFIIDDYIRFYCKEFCFSPVYSMQYENLRDIIEEIMRIYLRFDFDKSQRPSNKQELSFLRSLLIAKGEKVQSNVSSIGHFNEQVRYDMIFGNYGIKYFRFSIDKDLKKVMNDVKAWAWNCENQTTVKPIIVYSTDILPENTYQYGQLSSILDIFKKATKNIFRIDDSENRLLEIIG